MKQINMIFIIIGIILSILLVWGLIGSSEAAKVGISCDVGVGKDESVFCWTWHQNMFEDIGDAINQVLDK